MEFNTKSIIDAITLKMYEIFGDKYNIETGNVKQGFETPCFFVKNYNGNEKYYRGNRHKKMINFRIIGFSENDDLNQLNEMTDKLYDLEYITLQNNDVLRCINKNHRIEDNTLQFLFDVDCFIYKKSTVENIKMDNVVVDI